MRRSAFILGVCLLVAIPVAAQQKEVQPAGSGVQAAVDEQGRLRQPTAEEIKALAAATASRPTLRLEPRVQSTGVVIDLDESFDHAFVVRMDETGEISFVCTDNHDEAAAFQASEASLDTILRIKPATPARVNRNAERE